MGAFSLLGRYGGHGRELPSSLSLPPVSEACEATMAGLRAGAEDALSAAYDQYAPRVYGIALRVLGDRSKAEEVTQDVFVAAWRHRSSFDAARGSLAGWLAAAARNRAIDLLRGRGKERFEHEIPRNAAAADDVVAGALATLDGEAVRAALKNLPEPQSGALVQAYFAGCTAAEIAAGAGVPLSTIKGRMRLGLEKLAADLNLRAAYMESA